MAKLAVVFFVMAVTATFSDAASLLKPNGKFNAAAFLQHILPAGTRVTIPLSALGYRVKDLAWSRCGNIVNDRIILHGLSFDDNLAVTAQAEMLDDIVAPLGLDLEIQKRVLFWIKIPCLLGKFGSCLYPDICAKMAESETLTGDLLAHGLPPGCPFPAGTHEMNNFVMRMNIEGETPNIPSFIGAGAYKVKVILLQQEQSVACINASFDLEDV
ncbi:ganglioside GM2 activator-like [Paramacrobiotus metropolitanus]|uniref:ganglioside GM2 activator-like n=1 Tax=Paramacrobiotus metropolitanus TaxID=2943436 RepID=UPI002446060B|nr:ganglioside GM2 activator-like [Paramacrobiotus metropolitanus]